MRLHVYLTGHVYESYIYDWSISLPHSFWGAEVANLNGCWIDRFVNYLTLLNVKTVDIKTNYHFK